MSTRQLFEFGPTSSRAMWLGLLTFIIHSLVVVLEHVNLELLNSTGACQFDITNKSYKTGNNNLGAYTT